MDVDYLKNFSFVFPDGEFDYVSVMWLVFFGFIIFVAVCKYAAERWHPTLRCPTCEKGCELDAKTCLGCGYAFR